MYNVQQVTYIRNSSTALFTHECFMVKCHSYPSSVLYKETQKNYICRENIKNTFIWCKQIKRFSCTLEIEPSLQQYQTKNNKIHFVHISFMYVYLTSSADNTNILACKVAIWTYISSKEEFPFSLPPPWTDINYVLPCMIYSYAIKFKSKNKINDLRSCLKCM